MFCFDFVFDLAKCFSSRLSCG